MGGEVGPGFKNLMPITTPITLGEPVTSFGKMIKEAITPPQIVRTYDWVGQTHEISCPNLSDKEVASRVRMLSRNDLDHEHVCLMARDRIMALSKEKEELIMIIGELQSKIKL